MNVFTGLIKVIPKNGAEPGLACPLSNTARSCTGQTYRWRARSERERGSISYFRPQIRGKNEVDKREVIQTFIDKQNLNRYDVLI